MNEVDPQMLKGLVTLLLLHLVAEREDYGYALVVRLRSAGFGDMTEGTVYPALARLEHAKRLETSLVPSDKGPARKYYRITAEGQAELERTRSAWSHLTGLVSGLVSKEKP
ncbi:PadR family transcriptional regulator [Demequina aurantiaca]|uniref:PadR family transcriptional regulator n=1 Tax=Demequina aurantiaca TaxID=676200 RepID=UPI003D328FE3